MQSQSLQKPSEGYFVWRRNTDRRGFEAAADLKQDLECTYHTAVQQHRGDGLKLVVMSATLDAAKLVSYFHGAKAAYLQVTLRAARCE